MPVDATDEDSGEEDMAEEDTANDGMVEKDTAEDETVEGEGAALELELCSPLVAAPNGT